MRFVEKAAGWLFAIGLAIALVLLFNYLDVLILVAFRNVGIDTAVYRGALATVTAVANIIVFGTFLFICKKVKRPILQMKKMNKLDILLVVIIAIGMLGFAETFIMTSERIAEYVKSLSEQMDQYKEAVNRYSGVEKEVVPLWDNILYLVTLSFLVPLEEEMIFRGAIFGVLRRKMSPFFAIIITAAIFGIMHQVSIHTAYAVVCGLILTACYYYTDNLFASVIMHSLFNLIGSALGDFLKLDVIGVPASLRQEILLNCNTVCILMIVPAGIAFFVLAKRSRKRRRLKAESVTAVE